MKSSKKITRVQLKINHNHESFILGIVSADPDYKLSFKLNKKFSISLKNISPVRITDDNGYDLVFSRFSDLNGSPDVIYSLISNRSGNSYLLKNLKNVDFIFQVQDSFSISNTDHFTTTIREIDAITGVFNINLSKIKDKNLQYLIQ